MVEIDILTPYYINWLIWKWTVQVVPNCTSSDVILQDGDGDGDANSDGDGDGSSSLSSESDITIISSPYSCSGVTVIKLE